MLMWFVVCKQQGAIEVATGHACFGVEVSTPDLKNRN